MAALQYPQTTLFSTEEVFTQIYTTSLQTEGLPGSAADLPIRHEGRAKGQQHRTALSHVHRRSAEGTIDLLGQAEGPAIVKAHHIGIDQILPGRQEISLQFPALPTGVVAYDQLVQLQRRDIQKIHPHPL